MFSSATKRHTLIYSQWFLFFTFTLMFLAYWFLSVVQMTCPQRTTVFKDRNVFHKACFCRHNQKLKPNISLTSVTKGTMENFSTDSLAADLIQTMNSTGGFFANPRLVQSSKKTIILDTELSENISFCKAFLRFCFPISFAGEDKVLKMENFDFTL